MTLAIEVQGEGRDLVMLHGWGMNSSVWSDFAHELAADCRVTLIDLPGHGHSPFHGQQALAGWAEACLAVAPPRAVWLGWSLGSMVALQAAQLACERVAGLLVVAGMPRFVQADDWPHAMAPQTLDLFIQALGDNHAKTLERFLALQMLGSDLAQETLRRLKTRLKERPDPHPEALETGLDLLKSADLRPALGELACPTAWLYGDRDTLAPAKASKLLRTWLPQVSTAVIQGAAHTPFLSHPAETRRAVRRFMEQFDEF
ncbi:MAG: pimeloyl-ACP methyl ester esterase BioH [Chromatiales bacterium]|jgi:pimeloyl-[acyl-carrier protein] methyl ester esterase